jgi:glycine/D-amino acid oxidase-like deaminating enzyme
MTTTADILIIGGGPAGAAAVWAIERMMPGTKTILLEHRDRLGAGSSTASLENFRTCWPALCFAKQMERSVHVFLNADEYLGEGAKLSLSVKKRGYLFCGFNATQADALKRDVAHLHQIGLQHVEYLDADDVAYRFPWLGKSVIAAKYDPVAGWLDSNALIYAYVRSSPSVRVMTDVQNIQIRIENNRVLGVTTAKGNIDAPVVVIAAGAWSVPLAQASGLSLPIVLHPRQSFTTFWRHGAFPEDAPMLIGASPAAHVRPEAKDGAIFGWEYRWNTKHALPGEPLHEHLAEPVERIETLKDPRFPSLVQTLLARQFKHQPGEGFADPRYLRGSHNIGYYVARAATVAYRSDAMGNRTPYESERAIIDRYPGVDGLFMSVAHVGHGIMSSPAAAEILASRIFNLPLPDPAYMAFELEVPYIEYDNNAL